MSGELFVGTSGFSYGDWVGKFYPEDLPSNQWLEYYADHFRTLELNNTFYRLASPKIFFNWYKRTPNNFLFSIKANRRITHFKRLNITPEDWQIFWQRAELLKEKLGVILFQFPASFKKSAEKLMNFLEHYKVPVRFAFEFRHQSWFDQEIFDILKAFNSSLVFHDCLEINPPPLKVTADFVYIRFHGVETLYNYEYSLDQLKDWKRRIKNWLKDGLAIFAYFNNDVDAFAVKNAKQLIQLSDG